jgi:hypothetical protein
MIAGECRIETRGPDGRAVQLEGLRLRLDLRFVRRSSSETADGRTETLLQVEDAELRAMPGARLYRRRAAWAGAAALLLTFAVWLSAAFVSDSSPPSPRHPLQQPNAAPAAPLPASRPDPRAGAIPGRASNPSQAPERDLLAPAPAPLRTPDATPGPDPGSTPALRPARVPSRPTTPGPTIQPVPTSHPRSRARPLAKEEPPSRPDAAAAPVTPSSAPEPRKSGGHPTATLPLPAPVSLARGGTRAGAPGSARRDAPIGADRLELFDDTQ